MCWEKGGAMKKRRDKPDLWQFARSSMHLGTDEPSILQIVHCGLGVGALALTKVNKRDWYLT